MMHSQNHIKPLCCLERGVFLDYLSKKDSVPYGQLVDNFEIPLNEACFS